MTLRQFHNTDLYIKSNSYNLIFVLFICLLFLTILNSSNIVLSLISLSVVCTGWVLLFQSGESPVLFFILFYQWLQASISLFASNIIGIPVAEFSGYPGNIEKSIILSLIGVTVLTVGMRTTMGSRTREYGHSARQFIMSFSDLEWFTSYLKVLAAATFAQTSAWIIPGLSQPLLAFANLKWAFFWLLGYATFARNSGVSKFFIIAFVIEFLLGIGGYFSDFKTVVLFSIFAAMASGARITPRYVILLGFLSVLLVTLGVIWTSIKPEYRKFVSGGAKAQIVTGDYSTNISKILELTSRIDGKEFGRSSEKLLRRISYVEFFSLVLTHVPDRIPYENGALWLDAIERPFTPRIFFPQKTIIDDSERTTKYTGYQVGSAKNGASVSIGYIGEAYIDFGEIYMMIPLFGLGLLYGEIYRRLAEGKRTYGAFGMALATAILFVPAPLETSITKSFGGLVVSVLAAWVLVQFAMPNFFPWVRQNAVLNASGSPL